MSAPSRQATAAAAPGRRAAAPPADMFGNRRTIGGLGMPAQKAKNFKGTLRRLLGYLRPHRAGLAVVIVAGAIGTVFSVLGPKILGHGDDEDLRRVHRQGARRARRAPSTSTTSAASCSG